MLMPCQLCAQFVSRQRLTIVGFVGFGQLLGFVGAREKATNTLRDVTDCSWDNEWVTFRERLIANEADGFPVDAELAMQAQALLQKNQDALMPDGSVAYGASPGMVSFFTACNTPDIAEPTSPFCLYGAISAFWVIVRHGQMEQHSLLQHAEFLLGSTMRFSLDFMESSSWPISSIDILANLQRPWEEFRLPADLRKEHGRVLHAVEPSSYAEGRQIPLVSASTDPARITVWEIGVHASLSAEPLQMWARFLPRATIAHRNLIQDQYPPWLPNKCEQLYWHPKLTCDRVEDDITALFRRRIPLSATSKDPVQEINAFALEFRVIAGLRLGKVDAFLCTVAYLCLIVANLNLPVLGYFGHPLLFMVPKSDEERNNFWPQFVAMASQRTVGFAVSDAFLQMQFEYQVGSPRLPAIRTHALYTGVTHMPTRANEVLVMDRPHESVLMCMIRRLLPKLQGEDVAEGNGGNDAWPTEDGRLREAAAPGYPYRFITRHLTDRKFATFAQFRAALLWPYDMDLITFYEFYSMNLPIFMPSHLSKYIFQQDHMDYNGRWQGQQKDQPFGGVMWPTDPLAGSPFNETSVDSAKHTVMFTDYFRLPQVQLFDSIPDLLTRLPETNFFEIVQSMSRFNQDSLVESANAWRALLRRTTDWDADLLQL